MSARRHADNQGSRHAVVPSTVTPGATSRWQQKHSHVSSLTAATGNKHLLGPEDPVRIYTVFQEKRHPFSFCQNLAKYYPISIIFGSSIPEEICNKNMHVYPPHLFTVLIPYLVKIMIYLPVFALF